MIDPMKILSPMHIDLAKAVLKVKNTNELALLAKEVLPLDGVSIPTFVRIAADGRTDKDEPSRKVKLETRINARKALDALLSANKFRFVECDGACMGITHECAMTMGIDRIKEKSGSHE